MQLENHQIYVKYLLADLSESERENVERKYLSSDEFWESLRAAENDLIDSYIRGRLSARERDQFEKHFLQSPRRQQLLEFARLLLDPSLNQNSQEIAPVRGKKQNIKSILFLSSRLHQLAAAAAVLVLAIFLIFQNYRFRLELDRLRSDRAALNTEISRLRESAAINSNSSQHKPEVNEMPEISTTPVISMLLEPGNLRGAGLGNTFEIPRFAGKPATIVLALDLARDDFPQYSAQIQTASGRPIRVLNSLKSHTIEHSGRAVLLKFSSDELSKGDFVVQLSGQENNGKLHPVDSYLFSLID